jgi:hypothetical protein
MHQKVNAKKKMVGAIVAVTCGKGLAKDSKYI